MSKKNWIDVTVIIQSGMVHWPSDPAVTIRRTKNMDKGDQNNLSFIEMGSHTGTHMDAPLHFIKKGKGLEQLPFEAVIGPARVLGIKDKKYILPDELRKYRIKPGERIIFKTQNSSLWKKNIFQEDFVCIPAETAAYLASLKVQTIGVDYLSVGGYRKDGAQTHQTLLGAGIWLIEGLDLSKVRQGKYDLICLPLKIFNSDGAPARAIIRPR